MLLPVNCELGHICYDNVSYLLKYRLKMSLLVFKLSNFCNSRWANMKTIKPQCDIKAIFELNCGVCRYCICVLDVIILYRSSVIISIGQNVIFLYANFYIFCVS